ncbi:ATP-binding protein [Acetobacterium woodii]|uniref:histidine kinase n=1 Tax=Acetobacterium woodii (strain ATCC 29683 / DSM 1030 / JCM 2381 / KCTC 1655 / WB1) TaxID=931626 RepID=H6LK90_ACEWD|nr:ATP-binding protein [Acetobacterium woodii]AFA50010.1 chemotaxis protein histidine kinase CheA5 [Acetobacterium woodii DSM 1030]
MIETVAKLIQAVPTFSVSENGCTIHQYFEQNKEAEGVVIIDNEKPVGILMRNDLYQKIGRQFGYALYMNRAVTLLMKPHITCVDKNCEMAKLGFIAMNRNQESIYDFIVILENQNYAGVVNIREFLIEMSKTKEREIKLLNKQQDILTQRNEAEKRHRIEIEQKNEAIKNLLDHTGQGFLFFGRDLIISEEYSRECDKIFGFPVGKQHFLEIMKKFVDSDAIEMMENVFINVFGDNNKVKNRVYLSVLPTEISINDRYIQTEFKVIPNEIKKSIMLILTDITEKKALEIKNAEEKNNIKLIVRAISSKNEITQAIEELQQFVKEDALTLLASHQPPQLILQHLFRVVHTMKGDFALNSLHHTSLELHRVEDALSELQKNNDTINLAAIQALLTQLDCEQLLAKDRLIITEALGRHYFEKEEVSAVSLQRITDIKNKIKREFQGAEQTAVLELLESLFYINIKEVIKDYNEYIKGLAERFGKNIGEIKITGADIFVNRERYANFIKSLVHVFRNIADHGIETPDERFCSGKPEAGQIFCELEKQENQLLICLADDGRGVDLDAIRKKAIEKGIYSATEMDELTKEQILAIIFRDDFSTKNTVDLYSGRGVGLAAVKAEIAAIGGKIEIATELGKYTRFKFIIPGP